MTLKKSPILLERVVAGITLVVGCLWLLGLRALFSGNQQVPLEWLVLPVGLFGLHIIGAYGGYRASVGGIASMLGTTVLASISPTFLNIPFRLPSWIYFGLIGAQLAVLVFKVFMKSSATRLPEK